MDFDFSEEQYLLRDQARGYLSKNCSSAVVREILDGGQHYAADLWHGIVDMGWTAAAIPEAYQGLGLGELELCVIAEELGRALAPVPFSSSIYLAAQALDIAGTEPQKQQWLPKLAAGKLVATLAIAEGVGAPALHRLASTVIDGRLSGTKMPVVDGMAADMVLVAAQSETGELGLYIIDLLADGVVRKPLATIDESRPQAEIRFESAQAERLGTSENGEKQLAKILDRAAVLFAFEQLGGAQRALDMAVEFAKERYAFGRQIGSYQAIKHKLADMYAALELCRANCYYAAWALTSNSDELAVAAATARVSASQAFYRCAKENIQVHGALGFTWELDAHLFYRRAKALSLVIGGESWWKEVLMQRLVKQIAA